jgi:hypothetical protein
MSNKIIAAALIAAIISIPVAAEAAEDRPERGIEVVPRNDNNNSNRLESFAIAQPQGTNPAGGADQGGAGQANGGVGTPSLFALRPPSGVAPEGGNNGGGATAQIVAPPSGVTPGNNGGNNGGGATAQIVAPPSGVAPGNNGGNNQAANGGGNNGGGGRVTQQIVIPPQGTRPSGGQNQIATIPAPRNQIVTAPAPRNQIVTIPAETGELQGVAINGVDSASDLYRMLVEHGYRVVVRRTSHAGQAVFLAQGPHQRLAHYFVVNAHGQVLKHETIDPAAYAGNNGSQQAYKTHKPAHVATYGSGHGGGVENCAKPSHANRVAYGYGHNGWARY